MISYILMASPWLASLCLLLPTVQGAPAPAPRPQQAPIELAARFKNAHVLFSELDDLVLSRYAESKLGRETRLFMLKMRALDSIASELGVQAEGVEIQRMRENIEQEVVSNGAATNLEDYLSKQGVSMDEFMESLRLAVLQSKLAKRGLGIPESQTITGEQQEMWLNDQITTRGLEEFPAPWEDGLVLRNGNVQLERDEFISFLRKRMDPEDLRNCMYEILRVKRMKARMPDIDPATLEEAIDNEIENRRIDVQTDEKYKGVSYEQLLSSQGIIFSRWRDDPNVVQAALARLWVRRSYDEEAMREVYEIERNHFDAEFGEALEASALFLRAIKTPNELIRRDYPKAEDELTQLALGIQSKADFEAAVELHSEDNVSRKRKGYLGWVTRTGSSGPSPAREAIFASLDSGAYKPTDPENSVSRLVGPVRTSSGVLLLWIGQRRPKPSWSTMIVYVHKTLRQRFIEEAVDPEQVITYLD